MKVDNRFCDLLWLMVIGLVLFIGDIRRQNDPQGLIGNEVVRGNHSSWAKLVPTNEVVVEASSQLVH